MKNYIPIEECIHGGLYRFYARNFFLGIYNEKKKGFIGVREKFNSKYLFIEYHWDIGMPYGTVKPFNFLEQCPLEDIEPYHFFVDEKGYNCFKDNEELRKWLDEKIEEYKNEAE